MIKMVRCKYCNEVVFKDFHKEKDCAMKDYTEKKPVKVCPFGVRTIKIYQNKNDG